MITLVNGCISLSIFAVSIAWSRPGAPLRRVCCVFRVHPCGSPPEWAGRRGNKTWYHKAESGTVVGERARQRMGFYLCMRCCSRFIYNVIMLGTALCCVFSISATQWRRKRLYAKLMRCRDERATETMQCMSSVIAEGIFCWVWRKCCCWVSLTKLFVFLLHLLVFIVQR